MEEGISGGPAYNAFNTNTNSLKYTVLDSPSLNPYDAGRNTVSGNFVFSDPSAYSACQEANGWQTSMQQSFVNGSVSIIIPPPVNTGNGYQESCDKVLSSPALGVNFASGCKTLASDIYGCDISPNYPCTWGMSHSDVLSSKTGALIARITDPQVNLGLLAFGYNGATNILYAAGYNPSDLHFGSSTIYEISG